MGDVQLVVSNRVLFPLVQCEGDTDEVLEELCVMLQGHILFDLQTNMNFTRTGIGLANRGNTECEAMLFIFACISRQEIIFVICVCYFNYILRVCIYLVSNN